MIFFLSPSNNFIDKKFPEVFYFFLLWQKNFIIYLFYYLFIIITKNWLQLMFLIPWRKPADRAMFPKHYASIEQ
jgi:hypothetical protein